jgi:hypothetical protein
MPQSLEQIVQKMIDAKEPEENIAKVIKAYKPDTTPIQEPVQLQEQVPPIEEKGWLRKGYEAVTEPFFPKPEHLKRAEEAFTKEHPFLGNIGSFATDVMYGTPSPLTVALSGTGAIGSIAEKLGFPFVSKGLNYITKALSVPTIVEGAHDIYSGETWPEKIVGGLEVGLGALGLRGGSKGKKPVEEFNPEIEALKKEIPIKKVEVPEDMIGEVRKGILPKDDWAIQAGKQEFTPKPTEPTAIQDAAASKVQQEYRDGKISNEEALNRLEKIYKPTIETPKTITAKTSDSIPVGTIVKITPGPDVPTKIKQAQSAGFEYDGQDSSGNFRFKKTQSGIKPPNKPPIQGRLLNPEELDPDIPVIKRKESPIKPESKLRQVVNAPKGLMSIDLPFMTSAAFRQARPLAFTTDWFKAWGTAAKAFDSEGASKAIEASHLNNKYYKPRYEPLYNKEGILTKYREKPSIAEEIGVKTTDLLNKREEQIASSLAERIPGYGRYVRASNRAYAAFLNDLRVNKSTSLLDRAIELGRGPDKDLVFSKQIADFVNDATGRGKLEVGLGKRNINFESNAKLLSDVLWSPRNLASQVKFFNPSTYMQADPIIRKEYVKGLSRVLGSWAAFSGLASLAPNVKVNTDPTNADFGKIRIGNTRIDPGGGYQPLTTLMARGLTGVVTSSVSGKSNYLGKGYKADTTGSIAGDFLANRLAPVQRLAYDIINASSNQPVKLEDRAVQMAIPFYVTDLIEAAKDDPYIAALIAPASSVGFGTQTYGKGDFGKSIYIPEEYDLSIKNPYPLRELYK